MLSSVEQTLESKNSELTLLLAQLDTVKTKLELVLFKFSQFLILFRQRANRTKRKLKRNLLNKSNLLNKRKLLNTKKPAPKKPAPNKPALKKPSKKAPKKSQKVLQRGRKRVLLRRMSQRKIPQRSKQRPNLPKNQRTLHPKKT